MRLPTPAEISTAKADALRRFGRDELLLVELGAPIDAAVLVAPLDLPAYSRHVDEQQRDIGAAAQALVVGQRAWPAHEDLLALFARRPSAAGKIVAKLHDRAGKNCPDPDVEPLADLVARAGDGDVLPGLSSAAAQALLDADEARELWGVSSPLLSLVMASPSAELFLAAQSAEVGAIKSGKGSVGALLDFARQAIVWSRRPVEELLRDRPAVSADIKTAFRAMGGESAGSSSKSV
jgi:hypothetical protein